MWEQSMLTSAGQVQALRLLAEWWDASRGSRTPWRPRRTVADVLVLPPGYRPAHLDERLAEVR
jgi:hypothetical protein